MATFLARAFNLDTAGAPPAGFTDVSATNTHYAAINAIFAAGITVGCSPSPLRYCPGRSVTNAQMATFIHRACQRTSKNCAPPDTNTRPGAPTNLDFTAGLDSLHVTWQPTGHGATTWRITARPEGAATTTTPVYDSGQVRAAPASGHTVTGLAPNTEYRVTIQGFNTSGGGSTASRAHRTLPAVTLKALEVTQGLQNWQGDIALVQGKRTVVRAFLAPTGSAPVNVLVTLELHDADGGHLGSLPPQNALPSAAAHGTNFIVEAGAVDARADLNLTPYFVLDQPKWIGEPGGGDVTVQYRLNVSPSAACQEDVDPGVPCGASVTLRDVEVPRVLMVPLSIGGAEPSDAMLDEHRERIISLMPVPDIVFDMRPVIELDVDDLPTGEAAQKEAVKKAIFAALDEERAGYPNSVILGVAYEETSPGWGFASVNGSAKRESRIAWWKIQERTAATGDGGYSRHTGSHEFGHLLGAGHAAYRDEAGTFRVICSGKEAVGASVEFPYLYPAPTDNVPAGTGTKAILGPTSPREARPWGLDTRLFETHSVMKPDFALMSPVEIYSIMSYCGTRYSNSQQRWVDAHYHGMFVDALDGFDWGTHTGHGARAGGSGGTQTVARDYLIVSGFRSVSADGSVDVDTAPVYVWPAATRHFGAPPAGEWTLELLDSSGGVLRSVPFAASRPVDDIDPWSDSGYLAPSDHWFVPVADPPTYASLRISDGSGVVTEAAVSSAAPALVVTAPTAGQTFSGDDEVTVSWTGSDADGDSLYYLVYYSDDGGTTHSVVGSMWGTTSLSLPRSRLPGSARARFRVIASDGTRSTMADSPLFAVAQNPPRVIVHNPLTGSAYGGAGVVALTATGIDAEDGFMDDDSLAWSSSIDGLVASSGRARLRVEDLSVGTHVLTVVATDSAGATASASVTVTVRVANGAPVASSDFAHAHVGRVAAVRVLDNDIDPEDDIDPWKLRVVVPSARATAETAAGSGEIAYRSDAAGIDAVVYEACDRFLQCSAAEATIVVVDDQ